jgi:hypothetical protein
MQEASIAIGGGPPAANAAPGNSAAGIPAENATGGRPAVMLPVFKDGAAPVLWDDPNPWRDAWAQRPARPGAPRLIVPLGGAAELTVIDAPQAVAGEAEALGKIAAENGGGEAIVALATVDRHGDELAGLAVTVKRYRQGQLTGTRGETFSRNPGESESDFMQRAVDGTAAAIERAPSQVAAGRASPARLTATVPISGLAEWVAVRDRLAEVPAVRKVDLLSLNRQRALIEITYSGTPEQLKVSLADADLDLGGGDPTWQVRPSDAVRPR